MVTAEEKHQIMCGRCRFKFAYRNRDACPRCQTPIVNMTGALLLHYTYYHCTRNKDRKCSQKCLSGAELDRQIDRFLERVQISERFRDYALKYLHELHEKEVGSRNAIIQSQQNAYKLCLAHIDNLVKLKTSPDNADGKRQHANSHASSLLLIQSAPFFANHVISLLAPISTTPAAFTTSNRR